MLDQWVGKNSYSCVGREGVLNAAQKAFSPHFFVSKYNAVFNFLLLVIPPLFF